MRNVKNGIKLHIYRTMMKLYKGFLLQNITKVSEIIRVL